MLSLMPKPGHRRVNLTVPSTPWKTASWRARVAMNRPIGKLVPEARTRVEASAQANAQLTKVDLTAIEAAMMREMEHTLQKSRT
jgi:hypothetical protein